MIKLFQAPTLFLTLFLALGQASSQQVQAQARVGVSDSSLLAGLVNIEYGAVLPAGDLADRFGFHNDLGFQVLVKSRDNDLIGAGINFFFGSSVKEDSIMAGITNDDGFLIGTDGFLHRPILTMRGWGVNIRYGKITPLWATNPNSGFTWMGALGFMQHRIKFDLEEDFLPQASETALQTYDRLVNGVYFQQYFGYTYMGSKKFINFRTGLEITEAFTGSRRDIYADLGSVPDEKRIDIQMALKVAWILPIYENAKTQYFTY